MNFLPLIEVIGKEKCFLSIEDRYIYRTDTTRFDGMPDIVINVESKEEIIEAVRFAKANNLPIIPRGSGTGMSGGTVAIRGGIVLNFEKMDSIGKVNRISRSIIVGVGAITADIQKYVEKEGFYFPPDPSSYKISSIGGNLSENAGGLHCVKYGVVSRYIKGFRYIDADGNDMATGSLAKEYNPLGSLLIGSEGTLGIVYEIELDLIDIPIASKLFLVYLKSFEQGVDLVVEMKKEGISPSVIEIIDESAFEAVTMFKPIETPEGTNSILLIEVDGNYAAEIYERDKKLQNLLKKRGVNFKSSCEEEEKNRLNTIRRSISPAVRMLAPNKMNEDIVIPITKFKEMILFIRGISKTLNMRIPIYGHAGDGNLHVNILYDKKRSKEVEKASGIAEKIFKKAILLGGSITGEHGVGLAKKRFLPMQYGKKEISVMRSVKKSFDSSYLINPDKIFNREQ
ncbi:MAG: glycolate oxidase subunit GlcD [Candidatus Cloacimonadota bacterium]|nr:MAG: glycolate oxidase subunit GlcD [Candidatus Cloacimonadota bacterium]PIE77642.1 MAG: glycolate oxidase subunit GlcD [Candidatus Delongbacteria bacterium]